MIKCHFYCLNPSLKVNEDDYKLLRLLLDELYSETSIYEILKLDLYLTNTP